MVRNFFGMFSPKKCSSNYEIVINFTLIVKVCQMGYALR